MDEFLKQISSHMEIEGTRKAARMIAITYKELRAEDLSRSEAMELVGIILKNQLGSER